MKTGIRHHFATACAAAAILCATASADTFHLKDGRVLEGTILDDREDSYLLEVQVTRSIKDEIVVAKADIRRIERDEPDAAALADIREFTPIPDLLTQERYAARIRTLRDFIETFPESDSLDEVREILDAHLTELETIEAGGIKFGGNLLEPDQLLENAYEIESRVAEASIRKLIHESALLQALRRFHEFEAEFTGSQAWHELLPLMRQVVASHQTAVRRMLHEYDARIDMQQTGLSRMSREERQTTIRAIEARDAALKSRHDEERANRGYWLSIHPYYEPALEETIRFADQEIRRFESAAAQPLPDPTPSEIWRQAVTAIKSGDVSNANAAISAARSAHMSADHIERLEALLAANQE